MSRRFHPAFALGALALASAAVHAAPTAPQVATLACFHGQVRIESVCTPVVPGSPFVTCERQTLDTGHGRAQLIGRDKALAAGEWSCSVDQERLFVTLANGGSCDRCEQRVVFDAKARRVKDDARKSGPSVDIAVVR